MFRGFRSGFVEFPGEKGLEFHQHLRGVFAGGEKLDFGAPGGGEHHEAHDALAVNLFLVLFDEHLGFEFIGNPNDHGSRTGMDSHLILHEKLLYVGAGWLGGALFHCGLAGMSG